MLLGVGPDGPVRGHRVAITGMGVVAQCGIGLDAFWDGLHRPAPDGTRRVPDFDPTAWFGPKEVRRVDRFAQFSVASAAMALEDAGEVGADPDRCGVVFATGVGGLESIEKQVAVYLDKGADRISPFLVPMMMPNAGAAGISMRFGWRGPCETITTACAAGTHAVGAAARLVASGRCDVVIGGGSEAALTPVGLGAFANMTALSTEGVSRPFDLRRDGFVAAEAAGALVLEDLDHALGRGARIYGEILGAASTADAHHITAPAPGGAGAAACMELALRRRRDLAGRRRPHQRARHLDPAQRPRRGAGHPQGVRQSRAAGHLREGRHRPCPRRGGCDRGRGYRAQPPSPLDPADGWATRSRTPRSISTSSTAGRVPWEPAPALSNSFGFGGHNGCLVIGPVER